MDMKKILQAMDGAKAKAEVNSSDMKKFLRVVTEADVNQPAKLPTAPKFYITQTTYDSLNEPPDFSVTDLERGMVVASFDSEEQARAYVAQKDPAGAPQTALHQMQSNATAPEANPDAAPQPVAEVAQQSPEQIAYNQLRAQLDSADSLRGGANTYTDVSPEVAASTAAMKQKLAQMAAALKAKGIDAEAEYNAPDASVPAAAPVDLDQKYQSEEAAPVAQPDPKYVEYAQLMAKYDLLAKEAGIDGNNNIVDVNAGASPDAVAEIGKIKARAEQLAGPNLQAWEQARQKENAGSMAQAQANVPALSAQLENVGMSRLLSIVTEGKGPLNRPTAAESLTMQHYTAPKKTITSPVLNVQEGAKPSMIGKYFNAVEQELKEAAARSNERARQLAERVIERIVPNADGSLPDPSINRLTGKPNPPAAEPAPTNVRPAGATVEYGGETYNLVGVFGDGIRPRISRGDKVIPAKAYVLGDKMYVLLEQGVAEDSDPCWDSHKMVGTKKKGGKTVPNCVPKEAVNPAQQAAIAIAKKKAGKK